MAYVSKEEKAKKAPRLRALAKEYGLKGSVAVRHHSSLVLNIQQGTIDFLGQFNTTDDARPINNLSVNVYWYQDHFKGNDKALEFLTKALAIMNEDNFDHSDIQSDYFHVGWYVDINIGQWDKPYILIK